MKVALVNPPVASGGYQSSRASIPPTGIGYLAAYLDRAGIDCHIVDGKLEGLSSAEVSDRIVALQPDLVGLSAMTPDIVAAVAIARQAKGRLPHTRVAMGGAHPIALPGQTLADYADIDYVVTGEGEETLVELIRAIEGGQDLRGITGLGFRNDGEIVLNPHRHYIEDLDSLPFPAWDKFRGRGQTYAIMSSRGCPYRSAFCMRALGSAVRSRSPENVVDEIEWLVNHHGARHIVFHDETFTLVKSRTAHIMDLICQRGLHKRMHWIAQTRVDLADDQTFAGMKAAGCEQVEMGVESGNQEILRLIGKGTRLPQIEQAVSGARRAGLRVGCTFILGHPHETEQTIQDTIDFAVKLRPDSVSFGIMCPYPGTRIWEMAQTGEGGYRLLSRDWDGFVRFAGNTLELTTLPRHRLEWLQVKAYMQFYLRTMKIGQLLRHGFGRWRQSRAVLRKLLSSRGFGHVVARGQLHQRAGQMPPKGNVIHCRNPGERIVAMFQNQLARRRVSLAVLVAMVWPGPALCWHNDPKVNTAIAPKPVTQIDQAAIPDGSGGAIVAWSEYVDGSSGEFDVYAQRINSHGDPVWATPVSISLAPGFQGMPKLVSDGAGGAIIVWHDSRTDQLDDYDVYAQRVSPDGQTLWAPNGIPVCTAPGWQVYPHITTDGLGGAIMSWDDNRGGDSNCKMYVQRVSPLGECLWAVNGVQAADAPNGQTYADIVPDGRGGVILAWTDHRQPGGIDIYSQRLDQNGIRQWGDAGASLCSLDGDQWGVHTASDAAGGALFSWADGRLGEHEFRVYAQKVDAAGTKAWPPQGLPVCGANGTQVQNAIVSDGAGGAIVVWEDGRNAGNETDIYAQRISADGALAWGSDGKPVVTTPEVQISPAVLADGSGGVFVTWMDFYRGGTWWNIYAQHLDGSGQARWKENGIPVCIAADTQSDPLIITDGSGGSIIMWYDARSGSYYNIFAQQVDAQGLLGGGEFRFFTAHATGMPATAFALGELILFKATWTVAAPSAPGEYEAQCGMVINSNADYRHDQITYWVSPRESSTCSIGGRP